MPKRNMLKHHDDDKNIFCPQIAEVIEKSANR